MKGCTEGGEEAVKQGFSIEHFFFTSDIYLYYDRKYHISVFLSVCWSTVAGCAWINKVV